MHRDALLATVLAEPDADLPRLVYADFLEEFGDALDHARAEFIRAQVELSAGVPDPARRAAIEAREKVLLALHAAAWLKPLRARGEPLQNPGTHGLFRRGFVELVWMPAAIYLTKAHRLFARAPVRELRLTRVKVPEVGPLLAHPATRSLAALDLSDHYIGDDAARAVAAAPTLHFQALRLRNSNLTDAGAEALAGVPAGWSPRVVDVTGNGIGPGGRRALAARYPGAVVG